MFNYKLYDLCADNVDVNMAKLNLTVFNSSDDIVYRGRAIEYPYAWDDADVWDYSIYNIENEVYLDGWCYFPIWNKLSGFYAGEENEIIHGEEEDFFVYTWEAPEL